MSARSSAIRRAIAASDEILDCDRVRSAASRTSPSHDNCRTIPRNRPNAPTSLASGCSGRKSAEVDRQRPRDSQSPRNMLVAMVEPSARHPEAPEPDPQGRCVCGEKVTIADAREVTLPKRSCRLAGLLPRVRRTSVRDSSQTDGQLSHQAEAASGVAGAASRCRRGGRQTPGWTTCDSAARWPTSSVPPAIRHVLARGNGTSKRPARTPSGESERPEGYRALCCCETISHSRRSLPTLLHCRQGSHDDETARPG